MPVFLDKRKPFYTALQKDLFGHIFENQVRDFSQPSVVGNEKSQCLSSRGLPEESETHVNPSAIIKGSMDV